ncbi:hypothetical protein TRFO_34235 [Tritrichomonas foetus]|uniref:EF hand family protein n=1 Tax=Tritrichomonas foetus TaxID=1144522 RepID=A0A1J4JJJ0_9EUKA|nr:hypothetical protein TRFO_34235 [Tritrichomonas foetus]|eukprot:OHS99330.1 hypothetical protein TRFO_34235 [Tritrichomonas foetus]
MFNNKIDFPQTNVDYAKLIESFRAHDKSNAGILNRAQYKKLLKDMKLYRAEDFATITYNGVKDPSKPGITFDMARIICEASAPNQSKKSKLNSLIYFRGVDDDQDGKINSDQFTKIAALVDKQLSKSEIANIFNSCMPDEDQKVSYSNVARKLFGLLVWGEEDPYSMKLSNYSPVSQACLLI